MMFCSRPSDGVASGDPVLLAAHNEIKTNPDHIQVSLDRAHQKSVYSIPTTPELIARLLLTIGYAGISFGAFYSFSKYAKTGFGKIFGKNISSMDDILEVCGVLPGMMLSMRSGVRTIINLWNNKGDLITLGITRRWNYHEHHAEFILDVICEGAFLLGPAIAACSSSYAVYTALKPYENNLPLDLPLEYFTRSAQFSSFNTNAFLLKGMGTDELSSSLSQYLLRDKSKLQRSVLIAILNDYSSEIEKHRNDKNFKPVIVQHFKQLLDLNDPNLPGQFLLKIGIQIKFWLNHFCNKNKLESISLHDKATQPIIAKKTIITAIIAGFYTLPNYMSGSQAEEFAKQLFKFGPIDLSNLAPPGWLIGGCSFGINTLINTRAINNLIDNCEKFYKEVRGGYKSKWTAADYVRISSSILIDALYIFGQVGLTVVFPAFSNEVLLGIQIATTVMSAAGLGVFSLNTTLNAVTEYLQSWWWRDTLNGDPVQYFEAHPDSQDTLADICGRELKHLTDAELKQIQQLPTSTIEAIFKGIEKCFNDFKITEPVVRPRANSDSGSEDEDNRKLLEFATNPSSFNSYGTMFASTEARTPATLLAQAEQKRDQAALNESCCGLRRRRPGGYERV